MFHIDLKVFRCLELKRFERRSVLKPSLYSVLWRDSTAPCRRGFRKCDRQEEAVEGDTWVPTCAGCLSLSPRVVVEQFQHDIHGLSSHFFGECLVC